MARKTGIAHKEMMQARLRTLELNTEIKRLEDSKPKIESTWKEMFKGELAAHAVEKGIELVVEGLRKMKEIAGEAFAAAAGSERTRAVFQNMLGKEGASETLEYLEKFSELSEFTDDALKETAASLLKVGLRGADFRNALGAAADVAAVSTNKVEGFGAAIESLSRIYRTGKVEGRALGGLGLAGVDVEKQLEKDTGLSRETIKKRLLEGTLDAKEAMASIYTVMEKKSGKQLGQLGLDMAETVQAKLEKIKDIPEEIFKSMKDSPGWAALSDAMSDVIRNFGEGSPVNKALRDGLGDLMTFIGKEIKDINWNNVKTGFQDVVELTKSFITLLEKAANIIGTLAHPFAEAMRQWGDWGRKAGQNDLKEMEDQNTAAWAEEEAKDAAAGFGAGQQLGSNLERGTKDALDIHSPSGVFEEIGQYSAAGFAQGFAAPAAAPVPSLGNFSPPPGGGSNFNAGGITLSPVIQVQGNSPSADEITQSIGRELPSMLLSALEQLNVQAGTA
jgi:hypothetical protein